MFIALCAVVASMVTRRSGTSAENFSDSADYAGPDTRPPPADLDIEDPDSDALAPNEDPGMERTPPSELALRGRDNGDMLGSGIGDGMSVDADLAGPMAGDGDGEGDGAYDGIEPFAGEEYEAFTNA